MKVIYVAGPYRAETAWLVEQNIRRAEEAALVLWGMGFAVICPHTNTRFFNGECTDTIWLAGGLELLRRCDAVYVLPNSENSKGTQAEIVEAERLGIPVFTDYQYL